MVSSLIREIKAMGITDKKVLKAIEETKRHLFVPENQRHKAYGNYPLPIGSGQTISQPYTVARMLELLELEKGHKVLEIGAGSGYNVAVISHIVGKKGKIYALEIKEPLVGLAKDNLKKAGIKNVRVIHRDGHEGYEEEAPYDRIIVTAAAENIPQKLVQQLKRGGILIVPINSGYSDVMTKIKKNQKIEITKHGDYSFVPFIHG